MRPTLILINRIVGLLHKAMNERRTYNKHMIICKRNEENQVYLKVPIGAENHEQAFVHDM